MVASLRFLAYHLRRGRGGAKYFISGFRVTKISKNPQNLPKISKKLAKSRNKWWQGGGGEGGGLNLVISGNPEIKFIADHLLRVEIYFLSEIAPARRIGLYNL